MSTDVDKARETARQWSTPTFISVVETDPSRDSAPTDATRTAQLTGALTGMPFAVKDNIDVAGVATTAASPRRNSPASNDATVVANLKRAGAVPVAKTNMDQFATGLVGTRSPYGACHSVYSAEHISGGSSSGSAVAVAAGIVPFALGTDTAGSGRVPAALNGIVGMKPTRGLVSNRGVFPAAPSLDCVTVFTKTVEMARTALRAMAGFDGADPWSRPRPAYVPGVARTMTTVGLPVSGLDLDPDHAVAWRDAVDSLRDKVRFVPVDVECLLAVARLLYESPIVTERLAAFGNQLSPDGPDLDPVVRRIVLSGASATAADLFTALHELKRLERQATQLFAGIDAVLLPTTPTHPRLDEVAADPVGVNSRLGTYTNMTNLLDLCAIAFPAGMRRDGLPFGVQLLAPAFADDPLMELAELLMSAGSGPQPVVPDDRVLVAVCGAHMSGEPLNADLLALGGRFERRDRSARGYRLFAIDGPLPRPGLVADPEGTPDGINLEVWSLPAKMLPHLKALPPLEIGEVRLYNGDVIAGFVASRSVTDESLDISLFGSWRAYLARHHQ